MKYFVKYFHSPEIIVKITRLISRANKAEKSLKLLNVQEAYLNFFKKCLFKFIYLLKKSLLGFLCRIIKIF